MGVAALAALPAIALTIAVGIYFFVWLDFRDHPEKVWPEWFEEIRGDLVPVWVLTLLLAVGGVFLGLRFVRGNRHLLLFLRRFGFSPATQTVTEATTQLGDFWRVVTLDDDRIESLGSGEVVEGLVDVVSDVKRSYRSARPRVTKAWMLVMRGAAAVLAISLVVVARPGPDWEARLDRLEVLADVDQDPDERLDARRPHRRGRPHRGDSDRRAVGSHGRRHRLGAVATDPSRVRRRLARRHRGGRAR